MNLSVLLLTAIVIVADVEILKELINTIVNMFIKKEFKYGVIIAIALGFGAGFTLNIGFIETCTKLVFEEFASPEKFHVYDIIVTSLLLSKGSGTLISVFEQWTEGRKKIESVGK